MLARKTSRITKKTLQIFFEITNVRFLFKTNNDILKIDTFCKVLQIVLRIVKNDLIDIFA